MDAVAPLLHLSSLLEYEVTSLEIMHENKWLLMFLSNLCSAPPKDNSQTHRTILSWTTFLRSAEALSCYVEQRYMSLQ